MTLWSLFYILALSKFKHMTEKPKTTDKKRGCILLGSITIILISIFAITCDSEPEKTLTKQELHQQSIQKLFSGWNGSHIKLNEKIKESLNDPKSYEHIETTFRDMDSFLIINTTFTAKNAFGGTIKKDVVVMSDTLGNITETLKWID